MTIYRVENPLDAGSRLIPKGAVLLTGELPTEVISVLLSLGRVSVIAVPPLIVLPDWGNRVEPLAAIGIVDAGQFLEATDELILTAFDCDNKPTTEALAAWRANVRQWLTIPGEQG